MPTAVAGWIITAAGVSATGVAASLITAGVSLAFNYGVSKLLGKTPKGPKPKDLQNEIRQADAPMTRYVGINRASGVVHFWDWTRPPGGGHYLNKLLAVSAGGMTDVHAWYINDELVSVTDHAVTTAPYGGYIYVEWRRGRDAQPYGGDYAGLRAAFPEWTAQHRLEQVGTVRVQVLAPAAEDVQDIMPGGEPSISLRFAGDACRNPDMVTVGHTRNLAVQLFDILTHPRWGVCSPDDVDLPLAVQAALDAQDAIPLKGGGTRFRYHGGGGYQMNEAVKDVAERWLDGMAGSIFITTEGKIGIRAGKWRAPRYTITEDKIVAMEFGAGSGEFEVVTTLLPKYVAPEAGWQETHADPWDDPVALARYGEVAPKELPLPVVQHHGQARALAKIKAAKLNPRWRFEMRLRFWGMLLMEEENVYVHLPRLGIVNQPFWIDQFGMNLDSRDGPVTVRLLHARPESFDVDPATDEGEPPATPPAIGHTAPPPVPTMTGFSVVNNDGPPFIRVSFTYPAFRRVTAQYRRSGSTDPWTDMQREGTGGTMRTLSLEDRGQYNLRYALAKASMSSVPDGEWQYVNDIEVFENQTPPAAPALVGATGVAGGPLEITFKPDLGVNYRLTKIYRGTLAQSWADVRNGTPDGISYAQSDVVTVTGEVPAAGARYWLQSENISGFRSPTVFALEVAAA